MASGQHYIMHRSLTVMSLGGHSLHFPAGEPVYVPPNGLLVQAVLAAGGVPFDESAPRVPELARAAARRAEAGSIEVKPEQLEGTDVGAAQAADAARQRILFDAFTKIEEEGDRTAVDRQGVPKPQVIGHMTSLTMTSKQVLDAWLDFKRTKAE